MSIWEEIKQSGKEFFHDVSVTTKRVSKIGGLKLKRLKIKDERERLYTALGEYFVQCARTDTPDIIKSVQPDEHITSIMNDIYKCDTDMVQLSEEIENLKREADVKDS